MAGEKFPDFTQGIKKLPLPWSWAQIEKYCFFKIRNFFLKSEIQIISTS